MIRHPRFRLAALAALAAPAALVAASAQHTGRAPAAGTALDRYVGAPDSSFAWKAVRRLKGDGAVVTLLAMTSQRWLTEREVDRPLWTHWVTIVRPPQVRSDLAFLTITGGSHDREAPARAPAWLVDLAVRPARSPRSCGSFPISRSSSWTIRSGSSGSRTTSSPTRGTSTCRPGTSAGPRASR